MVTDWDLSLVKGFRFRCRPECGLCCYTTPAVTSEERAALIQLDPLTPMTLESRGWSRIDSRPAGGACHFLEGNRCRCHSIRPATCREFPLTVQVGLRVQPSVVLGCPGVDLGGLSPPDHEPVVDVSTGLSAEMEAVRGEVLQADAAGAVRAARQRYDGARRRLMRSGLWCPEEEIRGALGDRLGSLIPRSLPPQDFPGEEDPLESLPIFFDPTLGRVAWRVHAAGIECLVLREAGGIDRHLEVIPEPTLSPPLAPGGRDLLTRYLAYLLARDATLSGVYHDLQENNGDLPIPRTAEVLESAAGEVILLAVVRRALASDRRGELTVSDIDNGIRATDLDVLDRPTVGLRL